MLFTVALVALAAFSGCAQAETLGRFIYSVNGNCSGKPVTVSVADMYTNAPVRAEVRFQSRLYGLLQDVYTNWTDSATGVATFQSAPAADYFITIYRPGYVPSELNWRVADCPDCTTNLGCPSNASCAAGKCVPVTGECGFPRNHEWVAYECCDDSACPADRECRNNACIEVTGTCGYAQNHAWIEHECCWDSDCGSNRTCVNHACVQERECGTDADCPDDKACAAAGSCVQIIGECGHAVGHRWVPYECCSDAECASGTCTAHACGAEQTPTPEVPQPPSCFLGFALAALSGLAIAIRK